ncbi:15632_t:CDS:1, partial [Acaulospora colombiana]
NQDSPDEELKVGDLHSPRAPSPNPPASVTTTNTTEENVPHTARTIQEEDEDDSDPEDSERPWNCYLHIRNVPSNRSRTWSRRGSRDELVRVGSTGEDAERRQQEEESIDIKQRIACLAPAPHHPKVVAQFKVPYPLPEVVVDPKNAPGGAYLRMREANESRVDLGENGKDGNGAMVVTAEELKDIICCTGLWLVVREGYGGLTKKRKGDGWRLRG